ncbi:Uncharacterized protein TCAP_00035, partial [Tolypocladium capitatum]
SRTTAPAIRRLVSASNRSFSFTSASPSPSPLNIMASPPYAYVTSPLATSPPNPSPAQLPNKKRSSTLDVNAPPMKRRKPSNLSQPSTQAHPLRQTSFPPEVRSPYARSPSVDATSIVSGSAVSGTTAGGAPKKKRGRKSRHPMGDESAEQTPSLVSGKAPTTVSGQGADKEGDDDDDDEKEEMALEDVVARTQEQKQEEIRLRAMLVEAFDSEQYNRYELWRAAKLSDAVVKRDEVVNATVSQSVPQMVSTAVKAVAKLFAGEIIESARNVQGEWVTAGEKQSELPTPPSTTVAATEDADVKRGPLRPEHLREAWRRYKVCGESYGAADSGSASAVRIRENQRRSRARRKEYVKGMERKMQEYERRGVEATLEMQQAARTVAIENAQLRAMLSQLGASATDVDAFLQTSQDQDAAGQQAAGVTPLVTKPLDNAKPLLAEPKQGDEIGSCGGGEGNHVFDQTPMHDAARWSSPPEAAHYGLPPWAQHGATPFDKLDVLASASVQQGCCDGRTQCTMPAPGSRAESPSTVGPSPGAVTPSLNGLEQLQPTYRSDAAFASPMEMSCNAAAQIIAEMQGHVDRELAKERLGCNGQDECFVKNAVLFQILESGGPI